MNRIRFLATLSLSVGLVLITSTSARAATSPRDLSGLAYEVSLYGYHCLSLPCTQFSGGPMEYGEAQAYGIPGQRSGTPLTGRFDCTEYYTSGGTRYADEATFFPYSGPVSGQAGVMSSDSSYEQSEADQRAGGFMSVTATDNRTGGTWTANGATVTNNVVDSLVSGQYRITGKHVLIHHYNWQTFQYLGSSYGDVSCLAKAPAIYAENELEPAD